MVGSGGVSARVRERERESEQGLRGKKEKEMGSEWVVGKMGYGFFFFFLILLINRQSDWSVTQPKI